MKNIFEDGNEKINFEDVGSGAQPVSAPSENNHQHSADAPVQLPQFTPEQLASIFSQFMMQFAAAANQGAFGQLPQNASQVQPQQTAPQPAPSANNTGKRILFQSDDFEEKKTEAVPEPLKIEENAVDEQRRKSFYDDDELFDITPADGDEYEENPQPRVKTSSLGSGFSVAEIDLDESQLPDLPERKISFGNDNAGAEDGDSIDFYEENGGEDADVSPESPPDDTEKKVKPFFFEDAFGSFDCEDVEAEEPAEIPQKKAKGKKSPDKKKKTSDIVRKAVLGVSLAAIVISSAVLVREYKLHSDNEKLESNIANLIIEEPTTEKPKKNDKDKNKDKDKDKETPVQLQWDQIKRDYPNVIFPPKLQLKYAKLFAENQDFVGYLSADGVNLSLPVVQTADNEKYLSKNFYGKSTKYGCPFVSCDNNIGMLDMNTVIYGHHMNDGTIFGALDKYKTIDGFKSAPVISFNTLYRDYQWKVIAAFVTNAEEKDDNGYVFRYYFTSLSTEERFAAYLNELARRSLYDTGVDVLPTDKLLTLSTCSHEFTDARFVVVARLVRQGESAEVDVSRAALNGSPRFPQAYYDKKKINNPYKDDKSNWQVG